MTDDKLELCELKPIHCAKCDKNLGFADWCPRFKNKVYCEECMDKVLKEGGGHYLRFHVPGFCSATQEDVIEWKGVEDLLANSKLAEGIHLGYMMTEIYGASIITYRIVPGTDIPYHWWVRFENITDMKIIEDLKASDLRCITVADFDVANACADVVSFMENIKDNPFKVSVARNMLREYLGPEFYTGEVKTASVPRRDVPWGEEDVDE